MKRLRRTAASLPINQTAGYSLRMDTIPAVVIDEEQHLKAAFAAALLKHPQDLEGRFAAALSITADTGKALLMANKWINDPFVVAERERILGPASDDPLDAIFTKSEMLAEIWQRAKATFDNEIFCKLVDQARKVRGWDKPDTQVNLQVNNNKVMVVRDLGTDADWEAKAQRQQKALIDVSASKH